MKCYVCRKQINKSTRHYAEAKDRRYKSGIKDFCEPCYKMDMTRQGYIESSADGTIITWSKPARAIARKEEAT